MFTPVWVHLSFLSGDTEFCNTLSKKLAPPLVTLLSSEPEVQYVALRNINLIVQKKPDILKHEMKVCLMNKSEAQMHYFNNKNCRCFLSNIMIPFM